MVNNEKLERLAEKLLDTGKRNALISFKDRKTTAELVIPEPEALFELCSLGHQFEVFNPGVKQDIEEEPSTLDNSRLSEKEAYIKKYSSKIRNKRTILVYAKDLNPIAAMKGIAKQSKSIQDETGLNVTYLSFGFVEWSESESSDTTYKAPLLLIHVNILVGSAIDPVKIEITDDDVVVNPTFNYLMQAEHGIGLPDIQDGEALGDYYERVRSLVQKLGWSVVNECKIGIFSFQKINMYSDLKANADAIFDNENVRALLGEDVGDWTSIGADGEHVVKNPLIELHSVVEADSSQILAIEMAKSGKSFVLQGPPGTGKSQTITNIIAECLYDGKKVLFVSEKQAALNVVFEKLKKAGLADFCLELHSHKASKKAIIEELNRTLRIPKQKDLPAAQEEIKKKAVAQKRLDNYAGALHVKRDYINKSLYELIDAYYSEQLFPDIQIGLTGIQNKGSDYFDNAIKALEQYVEFIPSIGQNYRKNPWYGFNCLELTFDDSTVLAGSLDKLKEAFTSLRNTSTHLKAQYGISVDNYSDVVYWKGLLTFFAQTDVVTPELLNETTFRETLCATDELKRLSEEITLLKNSILSDYKHEILLDLNGEELYTKLSSQFGNALTRAFDKDYKAIVEELKSYKKDNASLKYADALDLAKNLRDAQAKCISFEQTAEPVQERLGCAFCGVDTDWDHIFNELNIIKNYYDYGQSYFGAIPGFKRNQFFSNQKSFERYAKHLSAIISNMADAKDSVSLKYDKQVLDLDNDKLEKCLKKIEACIDGFDRLRNWIDFSNLMKRVSSLGLLPFIETIVKEQLGSDEITGSFRKAFYKQWIEYILYSDNNLSSFSRITQDQVVREFGKTDKEQYEISKEQIKTKLSQQRPNLEMVAGGSALSILIREGGKKRKQMPIRRLLSETGEIVQTIKPCFLMSPLSVSTFLESGKITFDTVIFDEASQVFPQDAIGAIYRGKQLIVVGDSKQMPPSNFFNASTDNEDEDEDNYDDIADFESILDICGSAFNTERLAWHYRSHYEQLIAFSNANFYNNGLVTFPSSKTDRVGIGVDYYYVDGVFDRKSKTNRAEADFIVDQVFRHFEKYPNRSLGVVAFSKAQQNLIDKLLSKKREQLPQFEQYFDENNSEPFFVKNLETVQGDERDTIIFSVAYAKDAQGKFIQNFGPLNKEGGERRLNVAVTRAKDNVQLVASIHHTDINLANTKSEGVRLLRAYLDYAENGSEALERAITVSGKDHFDSSFEQEVCNFLRDRGFTVDTQVGCSGYRIDLGLRKPDSSDYLLAIECDGATYHSSKNARDRDRLRQSVLENMGWKFYRIWSTDWYRNTAVEKERLLEAAGNAVKSSRARKVRVKAPRLAKSGAHSSDNPFSNVIDDEANGFPEYREVDALNIVLTHMNDLQEGVGIVLKTEAPLSEEYLLKRIVWFFGRDKVTKPVKDEFDYLMRGCEHKGIIRRNGFLYLQNNTNYTLRVPGDVREVKYISDEELADGLYCLISENGVAPKFGLFQSLTKILGFSRTGDAMARQYERALQLLVRNGLVEEKAGDLRIISS